MQLVIYDTPRVRSVVQRKTMPTNAIKGRKQMKEIERDKTREKGSRGW